MAAVIRKRCNAATRFNNGRLVSLVVLGLATAGLLLAHPAAAQHHSQQPAREASNTGWQAGRASFYGEDGGATIHQGSCMLGQLDPNSGTGWDIAAMTDGDVDYYGSCGRCYEVACVPATFNDGYGQFLDRRNTCKDPSATVVVRITDTCPCYYPGNAYSNKRWCCGDQRHFDLSVYAYWKLADTAQGVMGIRFRPVTCPP